MQYSIGELAALTGISPSTLRYYDKEGFFPDLNREQSGARIFTDREVGLLKIIECLKATGMSIKDIKQFIDWRDGGDATLGQRKNLFHERLKVVEEQLENLRKIRETLLYKCWYYDTAVDLGSEASVAEIPCEQMPEGIRQAAQKLRSGHLQDIS
jgi:DNA-binding transcriptional MerR regulator